jgi:alpha-L-fucosidase 2
MTLRPAFRVAVLAALLPCAAAAQSAAPPPAHNLRLKAPITSWDDAIPLGNGLMGGLLWGEKNTLRLSLDRGDLWDERTHGEKEWWKKHPWTEASGKGDPWDKYYNGVTPTKLPGGRLEITLPPGKSAKSFELNLATAEGLVDFADASQLRAFYSAAVPVVLIRIPGEPVALDLLPAGAGKDGNAGPSSGGAVSKLGYPAPQRGSEGNAKWFVQNGVDGFQYCVCIETKDTGADTLLALAITSTNDLRPKYGTNEVLQLARARCAKAIATGYDAMLVPHAAWWKEFWAQSAVGIPDLPLQQYYQFTRYLYGAGSRQGAPPIPLQGVWTADNGGLPPWKGDYHNDLNTQMTYIAYQGAGNFDSGMSYLGYLTKLSPGFQQFARDFYGTPGLATPGVMSLAGQPLGGWGQYALSPTMTAWNAHLFYLHWRYTGDDGFLRTQAWPWCEQAAQCLAALLKPDATGRLVLPFSSSPEIHNNSSAAWLIPNSNYDLMCTKMLFLALVEMADAQGKATDAAKWADLATKLGDFHAGPDGELKLDANQLLTESHRHLSNLISVFPFNLLTIEGSDVDRQRIRASVAKWDQLGPSQWCGYSWAWMSCLRARIADPEVALHDFDVFVHAFVTRNGFHVNGDQTKSGYSSMTYRPFTLEGNFIAMQAVHEMLLQSWSPTPGKRDTEVIRLFPATAWRWHHASFTDLRVEGGHRVSAKRENNATTWFRITAGKAGMIRIRDNFGGRTPTWSPAGMNVRKAGDNFEIAVKQGEVIEATFAKPTAIPPAPAGAAEALVPLARQAVTSNSLPLHLGADSEGGNRFVGDLARPLVVNRALTAAEIIKLADPAFVAWGQTPGAVLAVTEPPAAAHRVDQVEMLPGDASSPGPAFHLTGQGYCKFPHQAALNCPKGFTLSLWVKPAATPGGARLIDKTKVGSAAGYLLDTWPTGTSLRLITREPALIARDILPLDRWSHVAATVAEDGHQTLFLDGKIVAESE